jgi:hypothetical protein
MVSNFSAWEDVPCDPRILDNQIEAITNLPLVRTETQRLLIQFLESQFLEFPCGFVHFWEYCGQAYKNKQTDLEYELGLPAKTIQEAFDGIGVRYLNKQECLEAYHNGYEFADKYYSCFEEKETESTYFYRNHYLLDAEIDKYFASIELV